MAITDWPACERPRERLLQQGAGALSDAELLAVFLRTGVRGKSAVDLARDLLATHGSLRAVLSCDRQAFCATPGLGDATYAWLQAALELARRHLQQGLSRGDSLTSPDDTRRYIHARLRDARREVFTCLFLDTRHRVIACEDLFHGTLDGASVHPREVVRRALDHNAAAIIFAHNHPSGVAEPSEADRSLTRRLKQALALVDIRVLDHLVVGDTGCVSFAERGMI